MHCFSTEAAPRICTRPRIALVTSYRSAQCWRSSKEIETQVRSNRLIKTRNLLPCRGVLSFRSEAREASGSETTRVHHAARRRGGVAARARARQREQVRTIYDFAKTVMVITDSG